MTCLLRWAVEAVVVAGSLGCSGRYVAESSPEPHPCAPELPFRVVAHVAHESLSPEGDAFATGNPEALVPVPGTEDAWLVTTPSPGTGSVIRRVSRIEGAEGARFGGNGSVAPFDTAKYDGIGFTPEGSALLGLPGGVFRSDRSAGTFGRPVLLPLPTLGEQTAHSPFVTSDGRALVYAADHRLYLASLAHGLDAIPRPAELGYSYGADHAVATPVLAIAFWEKGNKVVQGAIWPTEVSQSPRVVPEIDSAAPGRKYPTWLSPDACLLYFVVVAPDGTTSVWFARK